jgi:hypothetical protein
MHNRVGDSERNSRCFCDSCDSCNTQCALELLVCQYFTKIESNRPNLQFSAMHKPSPNCIGVECIIVAAIASAIVDVFATFAPNVNNNVLLSY